MDIRDATEKDLDEITKLSLKLAKDESKTDDNTKLAPERERDTLEWLKEELAKKDSKVMVAIIDDNIIGYIFGYIEHLDKRFYKSDYGYLSDCYVADEHRGKDVGKKLTEALVNWFKSRGMNDVRLDVFLDSPVRKFWDKMGFKSFYDHKKLVI